MDSHAFELLWSRVAKNVSHSLFIRNASKQGKRLSFPADTHREELQPTWHSGDSQITGHYKG